MPNSDEYTGVRKYEATELAREMNQIVFGLLANAFPLQKDNKGRDNKAKDDKGKGKDKFSRKPRELGRKLHEINKQNGKRLTDGRYVFRGKNFIIESKNARNVRLIRNGQDKPALELRKGFVQANDITRSEAASIHRNHEKTLERTGRDGR
ncbi:hypothetical protein [Acaryochloris marina]|uniref:Uncharacterized protein n=1 Tax=Acaryochloris marina (strain MBIC 11017) TaxID=329726 RepID=A8ZPA9_ACAM1|nr:hypothetical protein [Acaryochloris marina]ABW32845.1 hypothetical protein AM1_E0075 [Acaryochloris marina MBIC11017]